MVKSSGGQYIQEGEMGLMKRKKTLQEIVSVMILLVAIIVLFQWYTTQNRERIGERNKNYAADAAQIKAVHFEKKVQNHLALIHFASWA